MKKLIAGFLLFSLFVSAQGQKKINTDLVYLVKEATQKTDKVPMLIMLHGYGSNESDLFDISTSLDPRFVVFSLRAPNAIEGGGYCWYPMEFLPDQKFKYNYEDAKRSRTKVLSFISNACKVYGLDSNTVFLMGYSQGTILSYDIAISAPKKIKGVLALSGRMLPETAAMKADWATVAGQKYFIAHGKSDNVIKITDAEKAVDFLKLKKVTTLSYTAYEMPHAITGKELNDIKDWLTKAIRPKQETEQKK
jgi:phospholipase/carboxylesterase